MACVTAKLMLEFDSYNHVSFSMKFGLIACLFVRLRYVFYMSIAVQSPMQTQRRALGMTFADLSRRSGVPEPTVKRILGGGDQQASFRNVIAIAEALGMTLEVRSQDPQTLRQQEARRKAEAITRMAQATSALEGQAVSDTVFEQLVQRATAQLLSGSRRRLWFR
jgi:transcriptional regulator with XRE-family HTH domain